MVIPVELRIRDNGTFAYLRNLPKRVPIIGNRETWNLNQSGARLFKESAKRAGIKDWRRLLLSRTGIQPRKIGKNRYGIFIPLYGIFLDSMRPHFVSFKRGRLITRWAKQKGIKGRGIMVKPHPFVNRGFRRMVNRATIVANRIGDKIVRG